MIKVYPSAGSRLTSGGVIILGTLAVSDTIPVPPTTVEISESVIIFVGTHQFGLSVEYEDSGEDIMENPGIVVVTETELSETLLTVSQGAVVSDILSRAVADTEAGFVETIRIVVDIPLITDTSLEVITIFVVVAEFDFGIIGVVDSITGESIVEVNC